ncbi:glycosyltransferase family 2 protein [Pedobacter sp. SYSU D00535]|uniref:glycosyltransferase family 2 protein n=1 Tax=Pedobacter sp. SYSU D00535 TaxID=2810308 RepID=UPI001A97AA3B|nr:glycosyltransferase family 2 protein [Pedobacter sp. SYSU D00535]
MNLTIAIPTYNRYSKLKQQLDLLEIARNEFGAKFSLLVCDNCSTDETSRIKEHPVFLTADRYVRNTSNLGLVGNLRKCVTEAEGDFLWMLGDDDPIVPSELARATKRLSHLESAELNLIFLDPRPLKDNCEVIEEEASYIGNKIHDDTIGTLSLYKQVRDTNSLMPFWISAFWIRVDTAKATVSSSEIGSKNLMLPLYLSGRAASHGQVAYWRFYAVQHRCDSDSWSDKYKKLVYWVDYPEVIMRLVGQGVPATVFEDFIAENSFSIKKVLSLLLKYTSDWKRILTISWDWFLFRRRSDLKGLQEASAPIAREY